MVVMRSCAGLVAFATFALHVIANNVLVDAHSLRRRADDAAGMSVESPTAESSIMTALDKSVSTKITEDGKACIESKGYGNSVYKGKSNSEGLVWIEFDYQLETPFYVQSSFKTEDRVDAVERLMHETLAKELLGCKTDGAYLFFANDGTSNAAMPRLDVNGGASSGMDLVAGINTSPNDVQIG